MNTKSKTSTIRKTATKAKAETVTKKKNTGTVGNKKITPEAAKPSEEIKTVRKRAARKPKVVDIAEICVKLDKMINKSNAGKISGIVAVDVEVWGWNDDSKQHLYIEVKNGTVTVAPHDYRDSAFNAYISYENIIKIVNGKLSLSDAIVSGALNANGNIPAAIAIGTLFI